MPPSVSIRSSVTPSVDSVPVYDFAEHNGSPYLVMKFIEGETLKARISRTPLSRSQLPEQGRRHEHRAAPLMLTSRENGDQDAAWAQWHQSVLWSCFEEALLA